MTESANPVVALETSMGTITITLNQEKAPISVRNFLNYVKEGYYDGLIFHRVISNFMIQGGGMDASMVPKKTKFAIKNEATNGLSNKRGTVAMARTAVVDSATSQFFINTVDNAFLDNRGKTPDLYGYAVFGEVTGGMEVVDAIRAVKTGNKAGHSDVPVEPVAIISAKVVE
jgi:peptidyl-prolyl cis-trans isomerase B (cyclophilin B)